MVFEDFKAFQEVSGGNILTIMYESVITKLIRCAT